MSGKLYIASMNLRGKWADLIDENSLKLNVTSAQAKNNRNRLSFSPMTETNYKGFYNFEAYWQSGKVFEGIDREKYVNWWKNINSPKRRYPNSKGKKVLYSQWDDEKLDYISSRKKVYVPEYYNMIKNKQMLDYWRNELKKGKNITIFDFDGPRDSSRNPICLELTLDVLKEKINDSLFPFGHGYIVGALILEYSFEHYIE